MSVNRIGEFFDPPPDDASDAARLMRLLKRVTRMLRMGYARDWPPEKIHRRLIGIIREEEGGAQ